MLARGWAIAVFALGLCYPFFVYFALPRFSALWILLVLAGLIAIRLIYLWRSNGPKDQVWPLLVGLLLVGLLALFDRVLAVKAYPVMVSFAVAAMFGYSLYRPPCLVERMARLMNPGLNQRGVAYARRVSWLWLGFGLLNGLISLIIAVTASLEVWTLYNGLIAYLIMALLFGGEYIFRQFVKASHVGRE